MKIPPTIRATMRQRILREEKPIAQRKHPTLNIQHRTSNVARFCSWVSDVRCWMFDVFFTSSTLATLPSHHQERKRFSTPLRPAAVSPLRGWRCNFARCSKPQPSSRATIALEIAAAIRSSDLRSTKSRPGYDRVRIHCPGAHPPRSHYRPSFELVRPSPIRMREWVTATRLYCESKSPRRSQAQGRAQ